MTEIQYPLAFGGHGQRTDGQVELVTLQRRQQLLERQGVVLETVFGLLGDLLPELDAQAVPALAITHGEGRRLAHPDPQQWRLGLGGLPRQ